MATKPKSSTKTKSKAKNTQKKSASKAKTKINTSTKKAAKKVQPAKKAQPAKSTAKPSTSRKKPSPKAPVKAVKPKTVVKTEKKVPDIEKEKKLTEASKAFEKKIDEMAQTAIPVSKGKSKKYSKTAIAIIIIILAVLVYLLYPKKQTSVVKEESIQPTLAPESETEEAIPETQAIEPVDKDVTIYTVKIGDQLTEINKQFFGTYIGWKNIYEANKDKIKDPNLIFPGQKLIIPKSQ